MRNSHPSESTKYGPWLVMGVSLFIAFGQIVLTSAGMADSEAPTYHYAMRQLIWVGMGLIVCWFFAQIPTTQLERWWRMGGWILAYLVTIAALVLVWIPPFGREINGASRWVRFGGLQFQPSEIAKLTLVYVLSGWVSLNPSGVRTLFAKSGFFWALALSGVLIGLVGLQPDFGAAIVLGCITLTSLMIAGARLPWLIGLCLAGVLAVAALVAEDNVRARRVQAFLNFWDSKYEVVNVQQHVSLKAMALGGVDGVGLGESAGKLGWLPEHETDFVFALIGEEFGFLGSALTIVAYAALIGIGFTIAARGRSAFARVFGSGLVLIIAFQIVVNVAVTTACSLNTGLPLPFVSRGGSNILILLGAVGLLLGVEKDSFGLAGVGAAVVANEETENETV